jgi:hypothetical protein
MYTWRGIRTRVRKYTWRGKHRSDHHESHSITVNQVKPLIDDPYIYIWLLLDIVLPIMIW